MGEQELTPELLRAMFAPRALPAEPPAGSNPEGERAGTPEPTAEPQSPERTNRSQAIPEDHPNRGELAAFARYNNQAQRRQDDAYLVSLFHPSESEPKEGED